MCMQPSAIRDEHGRFRKGVKVSWVRLVHDKNLVLKIINHFSEFFPSLTTGDIRSFYNRAHDPPISSRHLRNLLRELEHEGKIKLTVKSLKTGGRSTIIAKVKTK